MQYDPKKKEQKVDSTEDKSKIDPVETQNTAAEKEKDKDDRDDYVVIESGLGIDE